MDLNYEYDLNIKCAEATVNGEQIFLFAETTEPYDEVVTTIWARPGEIAAPPRTVRHEGKTHWIATDDPYDESLGLLTRWALFGPMDDFGTGGRMEPATSAKEAVQIFLEGRGS